MDTAMGSDVMSVVDEGGLCAAIHARFLRAARDGRRRAHATVRSAGRLIVYLEACTTEGDDTVVAAATGSFALIARR